MFEVIISNVNTGRVVRRFFNAAHRADRFIDTYLHAGSVKRSPRNYRVEVYLREPPVVRPVAGPAAPPDAAAPAA